MIEEMRMQGLGVIADAVLPLGPGFTAVTGETGAGKTMVVTGLGLLLGQRADSGAVRAGASQASVAGVWIVPEEGSVAEIVADAGGELEPAGGGSAELYVSRTLSAEGRSRASVGGRAAPAGVLSSLAEELVVVHGQSEQLRLRSAVAQRDALDRFGGAVCRWRGGRHDYRLPPRDGRDPCLAHAPQGAACRLTHSARAYRIYLAPHGLFEQGGSA